MFIITFLFLVDPGGIFCLLDCCCFMPILITMIIIGTCQHACIQFELSIDFFFLNSVSGSVYFNECALDTSFTTWLVVIGSVHVLLTPYRCIGYLNSSDGRDARKFNSIIFKCVNTFLHVGGIYVSCCIIINATSVWNDDGNPICLGSDTTDPTNPTDPTFPTDPTNPTDLTFPTDRTFFTDTTDPNADTISPFNPGPVIYPTTDPTDPITDPTDSTTDCCDPAVMYLMLSLVIISVILGCFSCCCPGIVSLMSFK